MLNNVNVYSVFSKTICKKIKLFQAFKVKEKKRKKEFALRKPYIYIYTG